MDRLIAIENTNFVFRTNFEGNPDKDTYHSTTRQGNIIIPDANMAMDMMNAGFNVKQTKPREGEEEGFTPTFFLKIIVNFRSEYPPTIKLISGEGNKPISLNEHTIDEIDKIRVAKVNVMLNPYEYDEGKLSAYVRTMYVWQDLVDDPWAAQFASPEFEATDDDLPF